MHQGAADRPPLLPLAQRQHAGLEDAALHQALCREGHAPPARRVAGMEARRALVGASDGRSPPARGAPARRRDLRRGVGTMKWTVVDTRKGTRCRVLEGGSGAPVVFFHGAGGLLRDNPFLDGLAQRYHVYAHEWPGYGDSTGDELLEDMLDFALHGWDLVDALGLSHPHLAGHSMGGMIAAEMACLAPRDAGKLVLAAPAGLWLDAHPIPDIFAMLPFQLAEALFADAQKGQALMTGGADLSNIDALKDYYIAAQRRLSMAGKILFPIPNRRLSKRLYRLTAD